MSTLEIQIKAFKEKAAAYILPDKKQLAGPDRIAFAIEQAMLAVNHVAYQEGLIIIQQLEAKIADSYFEGYADKEKELKE